MVGLRSEIGARVRLHKPRNLEKMMSLALGVEDSLVVENDSLGVWKDGKGIVRHYSSSRGNFQTRGDH